MNLYGWSKHAFDLWALREAGKGHAPPSWCGLKFFNVFGPNEYHKGEMMSLVAKNYAKIMAGETIRLFKSHRPDFADGEQSRDFIYVKDCAAVMLWLWRQRPASGIYNLGTGAASSFRELMEATGAACGGPPKSNMSTRPRRSGRTINISPRPRWSGCAQLGYNAPFTPLEEAVKDFVANYLSQSRSISLGRRR